MLSVLTWKFRDMSALRDKAARDARMELIMYQNPEALAKGIHGRS
jgi:sulfate adenylyltransferase subunit 2